MLSLQRFITLGALAVLPIACAPGVSGVTPSAVSRAVQSGGGGAPGGGGGGGGGAAACQPLPGACVLNATIALPAHAGGLQGQVRFERSPTHMALTGTLVPGGFGPSSYFAIVLDTLPGSTAGYAARGVIDPLTKVVTLESLPGNGLFSQTPNAAPIDPRFDVVQAFGGAGWSFLSDPTPPSPETLALFANVHAGSSVRIGVLSVPGQICPCPAPGPVVPSVLLFDLPPASLR